MPVFATRTGRSASLAGSAATRVRRQSPEGPLRNALKGQKMWCSSNLNMLFDLSKGFLARCGAFLQVMSCVRRMTKNRR
ncbi:MAG: hypothetical protein D3X82_08145 [Candidatus Leucobacter sulfamidivorax]|nr:hypothetical protein [Candidatus Leucobacter sulfamidivorax]